MRRLAVLSLLLGCASEPAPPVNLTGDWFAAFEVECQSDGPLHLEQIGTAVVGVWTWTSRCLAMDTTIVLDLTGEVAGDAVHFMSQAGTWRAAILSPTELEYVAPSGVVWRATR